MSHRQAPAPLGSLETLRKVVTLPLQPAEAWFEELAEGTPGGLGPTDYVLVAVMRFDRDALGRFCKEAPGKRPGEPRLLSLANRPWFPPPVKAATHVIDPTTVAVHGQQFDAAPFAKGAYSAGSFVVVEGGEYVILVLGTS